MTFSLLLASLYCNIQRSNLVKIAPDLTAQDKEDIASVVREVRVRAWGHPSQPVEAT